MEILAHVPFTLDKETLRQQAHVAAGSTDEKELESLLELAVQYGRPKAAYTVSFVRRKDKETVFIDEVLFTSRALSRNLQTVERVFPFVATCGHELDETLDAQDDMLKEFWRDLIKAQLLEAAYRFLGDHLQQRFHLDKTTAMHPGSADAAVWPIEQQKELFSLIGDVRQAIGVGLTDSCLMIPNKTISGILFPTETDFKSCEVCHRENCPSRRAPFNSLLWKKMEINSNLA